MAEILIKAVDSVVTDEHGDPVDPAIDTAHSFKQGHPVVVMPDGHEWGSDEGLPKFYILKIHGMDPTDFHPYLAAHTDTPVTASTKPDGSARSSTLCPRLWRLDISNIPADVKRSLTTTGTHSTTWESIKTHIKNRKDGSTAS